MDVNSENISTVEQDTLDMFSKLNTRNNAEVVEVLEEAAKLLARYNHGNKSFLNALNGINPEDTADKIKALIKKLGG
jgi:hypothetical protein